MKHAVLGPGGVGGLLAATLARAGHDVTVIVRPGALADYPPEIRIESSVLGTFSAPARSVAELREPVDVLWVTCKAHDLDAALPAVAPAAVESGVVVPLLNGLDHVDVLRARFGAACVVPGAIRMDAARVAPGHIVHRGWHVFLRPEAEVNGLPAPTAPVQLAADGPRAATVERIAADLTAAGIPTQLWPEAQVIWQKLVLLAPWALAASAVAGPAGDVRADPEMLAHLRGATDEALAVAAAVGVRLDGEQIRGLIERIPDGARMSMERDLADGRPLEIANIADPIIREGERHGVPVPSTTFLRARALERSAARLEV